MSLSQFETSYGKAALSQLDALIEMGLEEDIGAGDVTSLATIPKGHRAEFTFMAREPLCVAGLFLIPRIYAALARKMQVLPPQLDSATADGERVLPNMPLMQVKGDAHLLLTGERLALNFLQRLCGVATLTTRYVDAVQGQNCDILDTRKTLPGYRYLDKYAVSCGGGKNHRLRLDDAVLIKDNHLTVQPDLGAAIATARQQYPALLVEVECDTLEQFAQALIAQPDWALLDNMSLEELRMAAALRHEAQSAVKLEASGGVNLTTVTGIAHTGIDAISIGALTHSATAVDIGLDRVMG